jgi:hypothetical protein
MQLSKVLDLPEFKTREIVLIGTYKTGEKEFAVLAHRGEKVFPIPRLFHLVELKADPNDPDSDPRDPNIVPSEVRSILARFHYFEAISRISSK